VKKPFILLAFLFAASACFAQGAKISSADIKKLQKKEDSLKLLVKDIFLDSLTAG
jgi:hypothetical protein